MSNGSELVAFLRARLAEDEAVAKRAKPGPWTADGCSVYATHPTDEVVDYVYEDSYDDSADHIALHDPARVLATVEAVRQVVGLYEIALLGAEATAGTAIGGAAKLLKTAREDVVKWLATIYADHPDYRAAWAPEAEGTSS